VCLRTAYPLPPNPSLPSTGARGERGTPASGGTLLGTEEKIGGRWPPVVPIIPARTSRDVRLVLPQRFGLLASHVAGASLLALARSQ
jgi:hypothetical protein